MKKIFLYLWVFTIAAIAISCDETLDETPNYKKSDATLTLNSSATSVGVSAADSLETALTLTWNDPGYTTGLENTKFSVRMAKSGTGFAGYKTKDFTGVTTGTLTAKDLNAVATYFGADANEEITLDIAVVSSQENNNETLVSNTVTIALTPFADLGLSSTASAIETDATTPDQNVLTLTWNKAFTGYSGVINYSFEYDDADDFSSPEVSSVTGYKMMYTNLQLNKLALALGIEPKATGDVHFRVKATNEAGKSIYSNTVTVSVTPYISFPTIGIIGDGTKDDNWSKDTDLYRPDPANNPAVWTGIFFLDGGKSVKFRANDDWTDNWGSSSFPTGTGTPGGDNIPVSNSGYYKVTFNAATGEYSFEAVSITNYTYVSLIGAESNWNGEIVDLVQDINNPEIWTATHTLAAGELKFRANHAWDVNWGRRSGAASTVLAGFGDQGGGNLTIPQSGTYFIKINVATGEFLIALTDANPVNDHTIPFATVGIIGSATPGGWDNDTDLIQSPTDPYVYSGVVTLTDGEAKFRADNAWVKNWGASSFPDGQGTWGGNNIPVTAGTYYVSINTATGDYTFVK